METEEARLSPSTKNFIGSLKEAAFEELQHDVAIKELRDELTNYYYNLSSLLGGKGMELLNSHDEAVETLIFISSYISYSYGYRDAATLYSSLRSKEIE